MKELNFLKRLSAITLAAAITAANVGFDFLPTAKKAAAEPKEENTVTEVKTPKVMTQKSKYPTSLSFIVEKNEDGESVLRASNPTVFNRYFTAELISLDPPAEGEEAEQLVFSAEGTVIRKGGNYTVNVKARINEETGELVYNPYKMISGGITIAEEASVPEVEKINQEIAVIEDGEIVEEASEIPQEDVSDEIIPEEPAEIPVITETSVNICESDVNAANGMFDMSQSQKLDYTVVKSQDSYNVMIPDDYDELFLNGIDEEGNAFFNAAGEEVQVNFNEIEMNIQVVNFAELKIKDIAEPEDYSIERFCGEETLPYYYGEIVKVTPSSGYNIVVGDMKFSDAVSVAINDDAVTTEEVAINVYEGENISQNFEVIKDDPNKKATVQPKAGVLNGMKYTLSVEFNNQEKPATSENEPLFFSFNDAKRDETGNIRVEAKIEGVRFNGFWNTDVDENGNRIKVEKKDGLVCRASYYTLDWYVQPNNIDEEWYKHENGYITPHVLLPEDKSVTVTKFVVMSASGNPLAVYNGKGELDITQNHEIANGNAGSVGNSWTFPLNPDAIHEDIYIDVEYEKTITFTFGPENAQSSVTASLNENDFSTIEKNYDFVKDERNILKSDNEVTFIPSDGWKIEKIQYDDNTIDKSKFSIGTAEDVRNHGNYKFTVTLTKIPVTVNVEKAEGNGTCKLDGKNYCLRTLTGENEGTIELTVYPPIGEYVKTIKKKLTDENDEPVEVYNFNSEEYAGLFNGKKKGDVFYTCSDCVKNTTYIVEFGNIEESQTIIANIDSNDQIYQDGKTFNISGSNEYTLSFKANADSKDKLFVSNSTKYDFSKQEITRTPIAEDLIYYVVNGNKIEKVTVKINPVTANPVITGFKVEQSTADKILNILTFGIFSNDTIKLTVYAKDEASNGLKISNIKLFNNGKDIDKENNIKLQEVKGNYYKTFTLKDAGKYNLTAYAESELGTIKQKGADYVINVDKNELDEYVPTAVSAVNENGEPNLPIPVIIENGENGKPTLNYESVKSIYKDDNNANQLKDVFSKSTDSLWVKDTAQFTFKAKDSESGIDAIKYRADNSEDWKTIDYSSDWNKEIPVNITLTTNDDVYENSLKVKSDEYKHTLDVIAIDHAGKKSDVSSVPINIDGKAPVITNVEKYTADGKKYDGGWTNQNVTITFEVTDNNGSGVNSETVKVNGNNLAYDSETGLYSYTVSQNFSGIVTITAEDNVGNPAVEQSVEVHMEKTNPRIDSIQIKKDGEPISPNEDLEYKYIFNLPAQVDVVAKDDQSTVNSDVDKEIGLRLIWEDGTTWQTLQPTYAKNGSATFDLPDRIEGHNSFDGHIEVMAVDNAGNKTLNEANYSEWIPHELLIAEDPASHTYHSGAEISVSETPYRDKDGNPLYAESNSKSNSITFRVWDSASGIKEIVYTIDDGDEISVNPKDWNYSSKRNVATYAEQTINIPDLDKNGIEITLKAYDYAGNPIGIYENNEYKGPVKQTISIDKTPPEITSIKFNPAGSANQEFFNKQRTATVRAKDRNFNKDKLSELIEVTVTNALGTSAAPYKAKNQDWQKVTAIESDNVKDGEEVYECEITFVQDAEYSFAISAEDLTTKTQKSDTFKFIIDTTAPKLSITFDNNSKANDKYYNAGRKATLTINEHNFAKNKDSVKSVLSAKDADGLTAMDSKEIYDGNLTWTQSKTNKDEWTAQVNFNKEGTFDFSMAYTDPAGNSGNNADSGEFIIDTTAPKIEQSFTKSGNKLATNSDLVPHVVFSDYNFLSENQIGNNCKVTIRKFGENGLSSENFSATSRSYTSKNADSPVTFEQIFDIFDKEIEVDGIYEIAIRAEDLAGNVTEINDLTVSINRFGPTYMILNEEARKAVEKYAANEIPIKDNIGLEIAEVNVTPLSGKGIVRVSVDGTSINELEDGFETSENRVSLADDVWEENENGWYQTVYKIDKKNFEKDGKYRVTLESEDEAGNKYLSDSAKSPRTNFAASFAVDTTEPTVIIAGADQEEYKEAEIDLTIKCSDSNSYSVDELYFDPDNKDNSTFYIKINDEYHNIGSLKTQFDAEIENDASGDIVITMKVKGDGKDSAQNIDVFIKDKAGNQTINTESFTLSATNNWLMIILIAAGVLILGTALFFITKKVRKR